MRVQPRSLQQECGLAVTSERCRTPGPLLNTSKTRALPRHARTLARNALLRSSQSCRLLEETDEQEKLPWGVELSSAVTHRHFIMTSDIRHNWYAYNHCLNLALLGDHKKPQDGPLEEVRGLAGLKENGSLLTGRHEGSVFISS
ncbi:hypothetical protein DNTS_029131 [Danionella cerebrum]|uniref:Uncharacterized protein n=1 Tax=Danionella cerebrum TaxID=2873325 RepID=A0A553MRS4_9TELE|nr:hypothetical protein DNTS_029131 [Danionella translucida]